MSPTPEVARAADLLLVLDPELARRIVNGVVPSKP